LVGIAAFSGLINLLSLTGSLFMLEVYDRVLPSRSVPTLVGLAVITALLFIFQGILELTRGRMLVRIGNQIAGGSAIVSMIWWCGCRCARGSGDGHSRSATSTPFALCYPAPARPHYSTCHGCHSTSRSALRFTR
jgi:ATP-binding cassette subfamily C protein